MLKNLTGFCVHINVFIVNHESVSMSEDTSTNQSTSNSSENGNQTEENEELTEEDSTPEIDNFNGTVIDVEVTPDTKYFQLTIESEHTFSLVNVFIENTQPVKKSVMQTYSVKSIYSLLDEEVEVTPDGELEYTMIDDVVENNDESDEQDSEESFFSFHMTYALTIIGTLVVSIGVAFVFPIVGGIMILLCILLLLLDVVYLGLKYFAKIVF